MFEISVLFRSHVDLLFTILGYVNSRLAYKNLFVYLRQQMMTTPGGPSSKY